MASAALPPDKKDILQLRKAELLKTGQSLLEIKPLDNQIAVRKESILNSITTLLRIINEDLALRERLEALRPMKQRLIEELERRTRGEPPTKAWTEFQIATGLSKLEKER